MGGKINSYEGNIIGIDVELAKEVFHRLNYSPEFKFINWSKRKNS